MRGRYRSQNARTAWLCSLAIFFAGQGLANAGSFYLNSADGHDAADGASPAAAWKSLSQANKQVFKPGDTLLLRNGGMWTGQFKPMGSGSADKPIVVGSYGRGERPILNGGGVTGGAVLILTGQSYWDIRDLEITNDAATSGDRRGVLVTGPATSVSLRNLFIHNIRGRPGTEEAAKATGGIALRRGGKNMLIEKCQIATTDDIGLYSDGGDYPGLRVRNNIIRDIGKNAMIIRGADENSVIEYNVCYNTCMRVDGGNTIFSSGCKGTVFQYNEGYANMSRNGSDGSLYDADVGGAIGTKWQYSYSHDNAQGLMWFCTNSQDTGIQVRYNISQNDKGNIFCFSFPLGHADIYNNVVYIGPDRSPSVIFEKANRYGYSFRNNIIYNQGKGTLYHFGVKTGREFNSNVFFGKKAAGEPDDPRKLTVDPMFIAPGTGTIGIQSLAGYKLAAGSPCINSGVAIPGNGGKDFYGNALYRQGPDRGAFEYQEPAAIPPNGTRAFMAPLDPGSPGSGRVLFRDGNGWHDLSGREIRASIASPSRSGHPGE